MSRSRLWQFSVCVLLAVAIAGCLPSPESDQTPVSAEPKTEPVQPAFEDNFDLGWEENQTTWRVATWKQNETLMSPDRCKTDGKGMLVQTLLAGEPARGGSMQSSVEFPYGRWVARLKPSGVTGLCNTMFTKDWDDLTTEIEGDGTGIEVDIELLTFTFGEGTGEVHLAVHAEGHTNAYVEDVKLDFNPSDDFHEWGFDILPEKIVWHIDGQILRTWEFPENIKNNPGYEMFFNSRSQRKWINGPNPEDAFYYIDWVRFYTEDQLAQLPPLKPQVEGNTQAELKPQPE